MIDKRKNQRRKGRRKRSCRRCHGTGLIQVGQALEPILGGEMGVQVEYCSCGAGALNPHNKDKK